MLAALGQVAAAGLAAPCARRALTADGPGVGRRRPARSARLAGTTSGCRQSNRNRRRRCARRLSTPWGPASWARLALPGCSWAMLFD